MSLAIQRAMELARAVEDGAIRPDEIEELAALVLVLLTCAKCDETAERIRCEAHK